MVKKGKLSSGKTRKKIIVGNWKMYITDKRQAKEIFGKIKRKMLKVEMVKTVICPPVSFLGSLSLAAKGNLFLGSQDVFFENQGSFVGENGPEMVKSAGASFVIIGHSERRARGDSDEVVSRKIAVALSFDLTPVICVGEKERDDAGKYLSFLETQIRESLSKVSGRFLGKLIIAYEPVWTIGRPFKDAMKPAEFEETALFIRKILSDLYKNEDVLSVPVLYGGSVSSINAGELLKEGKADGFLVGRESVSPTHFGEIVEIVEKS
ncbi:MAG: triose-phosphate isomerase [bacterium]|nr:triose-phosphate isomerase [bacterium]